MDSPTARENITRLVVGLGKTGLSIVRYLTQKKLACVVADSRLSPPGLEELRNHFPQVPYYLGPFEDQLLNQMSEIILSPGVSLKEPAISRRIAAGVKFFGDIELFAQSVNKPVIAITGSNGKSTVTTLVGEILKQAGYRVGVGGNLGTPALALLEQELDCYVLELSSFQLETTWSLQPQAAVVLNLSEDHLDRYTSFEEYIQAKLRIYHQAKLAVLNLDDTLVMQKTGPLISNSTTRVTFSLTQPQADFSMINGDLCQHGQPILAQNELKIQGTHNLSNALAATALCSTALQVKQETIRQSLSNFSGLPHRCQLVKNIAGLEWYDDSKGTNVGATQSAIEGLGQDCPGKIILIAGGLGKGADFAPLAPIVKKYVRAAILIGRDAHLIEHSFDRATCCFHANSMEEAVQIAQTQAQQGDRILLSPACASFDMFSGFEHRGALFTQAINRLYR